MGYVCERAFTYKLQQVWFLNHEWEHGQENPNCCKKNHSSMPDSPNSELFPILPPPILTHHWPVVIYTTYRASCWPAVLQVTRPVNQPQPIPECVVHVCYLTTARAPAETTRQPLSACGWNWTKALLLSPKWQRVAMLDLHWCNCDHQLDELDTEGNTSHPPTWPPMKTLVYVADACVHDYSSCNTRWNGLGSCHIKYDISKLHF